MKSIFYRRVLQTTWVVCLGIIFYSGEVQARIRYVYDNSGNRIVAEKEPDLKLTNQSGDGETGIKDVPEMDADGNIRIYPNPTKGIIHVEVQESQPVNDLRIMLYDLSGKPVADYPGLRDNGVIDVSNQPKGVYILKIVLNNKVKTLKIVKE